MLRPLRQGTLLRYVADVDQLRMSLTTHTTPGESSRLEDRLWAELTARLRAFVAKRIDDPYTAEDVAQDVLMRLHRSLGDLRDDDRLDAFAYRIARNAITDHYRSRSRRLERPSAPDDIAAQVDGAIEAPPAADGMRELARCLQPLVDELAEPYKDALRLTDLGELSQVDAAAALGLSVPGMKSRVQRARTQLHGLLTRCCTVAVDGELDRKGPCACRCGEGA